MNLIPSEKIACGLCGSSDSTLLYASTLTSLEPNSDDFRCTSAAYGVHPPIVRCNICGLVYASPRWESSIINESYSVVQDPVYIEEREGRVLTFRRNLESFEKLVALSPQNRRLLDVGCHIGVMVELAQDHGWDAWGVEPSKWASEHARSRGLHVITGTLSDNPVPENYFDLVTMWDVIEHLSDPATEILNVHRVLKMGGIFAIHTINIESLFARFLGKKWPWLMEMHLYFFSPRTLGRLLEQSGFEVIRWSAQGRFLRLGYFITRLKPFNRPIYRILNAITSKLEWNSIPIPVNFGDLFTLYARKL